MSCYDNVDFHGYNASVFPLAFYPEHGTGSVLAQTYVTLGLCDEAGEFVGKVKKWMRDDGMMLPLSVQRRTEMLKELGDILWYINAAANESGTSLRDVAEQPPPEHWPIHDWADMALRLYVQAAHTAERALANWVRGTITPNSLQLAHTLKPVLHYVLLAADRVHADAVGADSVFDLGVALQTLMNVNAEKLLDRAVRGVLGGSGDNR